MSSALLDLKIGKCLVNETWDQRDIAYANGYQQLYAFPASAANLVCCATYLI